MDLTLVAYLGTEGSVADARAKRQRYWRSWLKPKRVFKTGIGQFGISREYLDERHSGCREYTRTEAEEGGSKWLLAAIHPKGVA